MKNIVISLLISIPVTCLAQPVTDAIIPAAMTIESSVVDCDILWIGTQNGLYWYNENTTETGYLNEENSNFKSDYVCRIIVDRNGIKWIRTNEGIYELDGDQLSRVANASGTSDYPNTVSLAADVENNIWYTSWGKVYKYDPAEKKTENVVFAQPVERLAGDQYGNIWFAAENFSNLYLYKYSGTITYIDSSRCNFGETAISSLFIDKEENAWISYGFTCWAGKDDINCNNGGIYLRKAEGGWLSCPAVHDFYSGGGFAGILESEDGTYYANMPWGQLAGFSQMVSLQPGTDTILITQVFPGENVPLSIDNQGDLICSNEDNQLYKLENPDQILGLNGLRIEVNWMDIIFTRENDMWIGESDHIIEYKNSKFTDKSPSGNISETAYYTGICTDPSGKIYVTSDKGLFTWNGNAWSFTSSADIGLPDESPEGCAAGKDSNVWVISDSKLFQFNGSSWIEDTIPMDLHPKKIQVIDSLLYVFTYLHLFTFNGSDWQQLNFPDNAFDYNATIAKDSSGTLWITNQGNGLYRMEGDSARLINSNLTGIIADTQDNALWGFRKFYGELYRFSGEAVTDSFSLIKNPTAFYRDNSNNFLFTLYGYSGLEAFNPNGLTRYTYTPGIPENKVPVHCGETPTGNPLLKLYPNPANRNIFLSFYLAAESKYSISIFDMYGTKVVYYDAGDQPGGWQDESIVIQDLIPGMYIVQVNAASLTLSAKFVKF